LKGGAISALFYWLGHRPWPIHTDTRKNVHDTAELFGLFVEVDFPLPAEYRNGKVWKFRWFVVATFQLFRRRKTTPFQVRKISVIKAIGGAEVQVPFSGIIFNTKPERAF
jgi:hypothetical protein